MTSKIRVSRETKRMVYKRYVECPLCHTVLTKTNRTIEHLIPMAVAKWTDSSQYEFNDIRNLTVLCSDCNLRQGSRIKTDKYYRAVCQTEEDYQQFLEFQKEKAEAIQEYEKLLNELMRKMPYCYDCGRPWWLQHSVPAIRRRDMDKERTIDNAVLVCSRCNSRHWYR